MYRSIIPILICAILPMILFGQDILEEERSMSLGSTNAMIVDLPYASNKVAEQVWKDFIKSYGGKTKKLRKQKEWFTNNAYISEINGNESIDIYATTEGTNDYARLVVWFDLGTSFLQSQENKSGFKAARDMLNEYAYEVKREMIRIELGEAEKDFTKLESNLKRLKKDNEGYHKDIETARERILKAESNIEQNLIEQSNAKRDIEGQGEAIREIKNRLDKVGKKNKGS